MLWPGTELYYLCCQLESAHLPRQSPQGLKLPPALAIASRVLQPHVQLKKKSGYKQFLIACEILTRSTFGERIDYADKSNRYIIIKLLITWISVLVSLCNSSQPLTPGLI